MAARRTYKMINFDLSTKRLVEEFGERSYRKGYALILRFFTANSFEHHQYSGYLSTSAMSYAEVYNLVLDTMASKLPWLANCVEKFDATNVTSQSDMLKAIRSNAEKPNSSVVPVLLEGDEEVTI
ncbi:MAG: hypothetical protein LBL86_04025 [Coriobacteriales bacterium]|jgi:virulence-associated protein VapD|nr:hypothetical protein [Coriobacteriales bacterium]